MIRRETKDERRKSVILSASEGSRNCFTPYVIASNTNSERSVGAKVARQSQSGFTLMELLVYMMIVGIIVLVAGQAFTDSTKFRVRTQNMLKATQEAENVATLFKADVSQMGAKSSMEARNIGGEDDFEDYKADIYIDPDNEDSSSYFIQNKESGKYDSVAILKVRYDESGKYQAIEKAEWYVENEILKRACRLINKSASFDATSDPCSNGKNSTPTPVEIATGVKKFLVQAGVPQIRSNASENVHKEEQLFPQGGGKNFRLLPRQAEPGYQNITVGDGGPSVDLSGFTSSYDTSNATLNEDATDIRQVYVAENDGNNSGNWKSLCSKFRLEPGIEYEISFFMTYPSSVDDKMQMFVQGRDHMAVGLRDGNGNKPSTLEDFLFYPPTNKNSEGTRAMRFTVPDTLKNMCLAFTFAIYSPAFVTNDGTVTISNLKLRQVATSTYDFSNAILLPKDRKNVKALKLNLEIARGVKNGQRGETGNVEIVVPAPSNGPRD